MARKNKCPNKPNVKPVTIIHRDNNGDEIPLTIEYESWSDNRGRCTFFVSWPCTPKLERIHGELVKITRQSRVSFCDPMTHNFPRPEDVDDFLNTRADQHHMYGTNYKPCAECGEIFTTEIFCEKCWPKVAP